MITTARQRGLVAELSLLAAVDAHEGPVYFADENALYFTTLPRPGVDRSQSVQIKRLPLDDPADVSVLVDAANGANGMTSDRDGSSSSANREAAGNGADQPN